MKNFLDIKYIMIEYLIKNKLIKKNLSASIIEEYINFSNDYYQYRKGKPLTFRFIRFFNEYYKNNGCNCCRKFKRRYETQICKKCCVNRMCKECDKTNYYLCVYCIKYCEMCFNIREYLVDCETCKISHCNSNCGLIINFDSKKYNFCSKKCIPYELRYKMCLKEVKSKYREKQLENNLKLYNVDVEHLYFITHIGFNYVSKKIKKLIDNYVLGNIDWSFEKVSQKLCEIKYLYECCEIKYHIEKIRINNLSEQVMYELCKKNALKNKEFPIVWCWDYNIKEKHNVMMYECIEEIKLLPRTKYFPGGSIFLELEKSFLEKSKRI